MKRWTKDSKEFWVAFTEIRTSLPNQLIPGHSFTSTGKNDKPTQMTNPSCDYYHGMVDHYSSNIHIRTDYLTTDSVFNALWSSMSTTWQKSLESAMWLDRWIDNHDMSIGGPENIIKNGLGWIVTVYVVPKYGHAWYDGTRDAKPIKIKLTGVSTIQDFHPTKYKFYADYHANL